MSRLTCICEDCGEFEDYDNMVYVATKTFFLGEMHKFVCPECKDLRIKNKWTKYKPLKRGE